MSGLDRKFLAEFIKDCRKYRTLASNIQLKAIRLTLKCLRDGSIKRPSRIKAHIFKVKEGRYGLAVESFGCDLCRWWESEDEIRDFCLVKNIELIDRGQI